MVTHRKAVLVLKINSVNVEQEIDIEPARLVSKVVKMRSSKVNILLRRHSLRLSC